ncbi:hypothetical protein cypCar_00026091 [Cyprinus carpio]|nr:hypothetical protein cypCar_00026091 [Cyprinus carpio]
MQSITIRAKCVADLDEFRKDEGFFRDAQHLSELRIVLMGYRAAGKSSTGNSILGREEFDSKRSAQCVRRHGEVADRHITVIEAPGWWRSYTVEDSSELLKQEIVLSVSLCPPGPHAVLLIIRVDTRFKEINRKSVQGHMDLLGERVWSNTLVLFTCGDSLLDTSIEQHIESEGQDLQWLLDKCGNRYHVLNNQKRSDDTQIKELLEKIEETVAQNNGCHFEINRKLLQEIKERRRAEEERAEERMKRMKKQRENIRSQMRPHAVLLIIRVDIGFKETNRKALQGHLDLLGERVWSHTIVLFTHGDSLLDTSIEQHIESEGQDLQWLLDKCGNRYHVLNNKNRSDDTQIKELLEKIDETVAQNNWPVRRKSSPIKIQGADNKIKSQELMQPCIYDVRSQKTLTKKKFQVCY